MDVNTLYKDLMFSVVRLVTSKGDDSGNTGTSLLVDLELEPGKTAPVLITNKHVVEDAVEISLHIPMAQGPERVVLGDTIEIKMQLEGDGFFSPPGGDVDLAIIPFGAVLMGLRKEFPGRSPFIRPLPVSEFPSNEEYATLDALEQVFFLGFPNGRWDTVNRTPIMRQGVTATPATLHFDGRPQFLIDASVFPGSSGSPLFVARTRTLRYGKGLVTEQLAIFAGIVTESYERENTVPVFATEVGVPESLDLGVVTNLTAIKQALDQYCDYAKVQRPKFRTSPLSSLK